MLLHCIHFQQISLQWHCIIWDTRWMYAFPESRFTFTHIFSRRSIYCCLRCDAFISCGKNKIQMTSNQEEKIQWISSADEFVMGYGPQCLFIQLSFDWKKKNLLPFWLIFLNDKKLLESDYFHKTHSFRMGSGHIKRNPIGIWTEKNGNKRNKIKYGIVSLKGPIAQVVAGLIGSQMRKSLFGETLL